MHSHPEHSDDPQPRSSKSRVLIGIGVTAILVILAALHLTGLVEAGSG
jgi:hypothetical protein